MIRASIRAALAGLCLATGLPGFAVGPTVSVGTGFETAQGFAVGNLDGQAGWRVDAGTAEVWTRTVFSGAQAARLAPGGAVSRDLPPGTSRVTLKSRLQASPSSAPELPFPSQAAVLYLDAVHGLTGLDGDGSGGGTWVESGRTLTPGAWYEVTLVLDLEQRTWECRVDGETVLQSLRFASDAVVGLRTLAASAGTGDTLIDDFEWREETAPAPASPDPVPAGTIGTGFEVSEGYLLGNLDAQNGWSVEAGLAEVWDRTVFEGTQAARLAPGARVARRLASGLSQTTFTSYVQAAPSAAPDIPLLPQAAVLYLDPVTGLTGLDGDGQGGGTWVGSKVAPAAGSWFQLTVELDFDTHRWNCLVNGAPALTGLRFHSDQVIALGTLTAAATAGDTLLDATRFTGILPPSSPGTNAPPPVPGVALGIGFEPEEGYVLGDLDGQDRWTVDAGDAVVWTTRTFSGLQAARLAPGSQASHAFPSGLPVVQVRSMVQAAPGPAPDLPITAQAAVLYLDPVLGLTGLDGDGQGGGSWVGSGISVPTGDWFEVSLRLDFARKTWDCLVDGRLALAGLHFHSDAVAAFGTFAAAANTADTLLDALAIHGLNPDSSPDLALLPSQVGFEPAEGYRPGPLDGQDAWITDGTDAEVWTQTVFSGVQAARLNPGDRATRHFATADSIVTVEAWLLASPTSQPEAPAPGQIAVLYLDPATGITGLDGDGQGGGRWVGSGVAVGADTWFRATVRMDFTSRTWSCAINGNPALTNLNFLTRDASAFASFTAAAGPSAAALVDQISVVSESVPFVPVRLQIVWAGGNVELSWEDTGIPYRLQVAEDLGSPTWTDLAAPGNRLSLNPAPTGPRFFRLTTP